MGKGPTINSGTRYYHLTVIKQVKSCRHGSRVFKCRCDCGKTSNVKYFLLSKGMQKSCGCKLQRRKYRTKQDVLNKAQELYLENRDNLLLTNLNKRNHFVQTIKALYDGNLKKFYQDLNLNYHDFSRYEESYENPKKSLMELISTKKVKSVKDLRLKYKKLYRQLFFSCNITKLLKEIDLPYSRLPWTKDRLVTELKAFKDSFGAINSSIINTHRPDLYWAMRKFGGFEKALSLAGISRALVKPHSSSYQQALSEFLLAEIPTEVFENYKTTFLGNMHLDFYLPDLQLAIEVDGPQHRRVIKHFNKSVDRLKLQKDSDKRKDMLCLKNNITLLRINTDVFNLESISECLEEHEDYIKECKELGLDLLPRVIRV